MAHPLQSVVPNLLLEREFARLYGVKSIAGIDEAGRGALAGPVFAAAVVLSFDDDTLLESLCEVRDSKLISPNLRQSLFAVICHRALAFGIGQVPAGVIDQIGILPATHLAMIDAVGRLALPVDGLLIDGPIRLALSLPQRAIIRGDQQSLSIAAASILAKVARDQYMTRLVERWPNYGFERHKGYGTVEHRRALERLGPCDEHRRSFAPLSGSRRP